MSHATLHHDVAQPTLPASEDLTVQTNKSKTNTLNSLRNGNTSNYSSPGPEKLTVLDMILESLALRNLTSKDMGTLISKSILQVFIHVRHCPRINPILLRSFYSAGLHVSAVCDKRDRVLCDVVYRILQ